MQKYQEKILVNPYMIQRPPGNGSTLEQVLAKMPLYPISVRRGLPIGQEARALLCDRLTIAGLTAPMLPVLLRSKPDPNEEERERHKRVLEEQKRWEERAEREAEELKRQMEEARRKGEI